MATLALVGAGFVAFAPSGGSVTQDFFHSDGPQSFTVPAGVCQVTIGAYGANGQDGSDGNGGSGGGIQAVFPVDAGDVLTVLVGENGDDSGTGFNDGGPGAGTGGRGGGSSGVSLGSATLIVAGGGGGGGAGGDGGAGGAAVSVLDLGDGDNGTGTTGGAGGTAGGTAGDGTAGATNAGGGGAGANPGAGGTGSGGGGGGGNDADSADISFPDFSSNSRDGIVRITADPRVGCDPVLQVRKVVQGGTAPSGFTIVVNCTREAPVPPANVAAQATEITVNNVSLPYNKDGSPNGSSPPAGWSVSGGVWSNNAENLTGSTCNATETETAGALQVSYACSWSGVEPDPTTGTGCPGAAAGPSATPLSVALLDLGDIGELTVTNTFVDFTG